jgi:quinolinate synthase
MLTTKQLQEEIIRLKKEKDVCILAHAYQTHDIIEIADFVGDSFGLSQKAQNAPQKNILMCGVRFMAETAKILSPEKRVFLSHPEATCPMAEQLTLDELAKLREQYPDYAVVAYINTTSKLKSLCDVCVTSASAYKIVKALPQKNIIFIPDCNLGAWIAEKIPEKNFVFIKGGCPIHTRITVDDVIHARAQHPNAKLLVHPECIAEVTKRSDFAGSTTAIMDYVKNSDSREFIIGTDNAIVSHLQFEYPEKRFYELSKICVCHDMRLTTLVNVYDCLMGDGGEEITLDSATNDGAKRCIDAMLSYGG